MPACAASISSGSGIEPQNRYESREAISYGVGRDRSPCLHRLAQLDPVEELGRLQRPLDDGANTRREVARHPTRLMEVNDVVSRDSTSGRRNACRPTVVMSLLLQVASLSGDGAAGERSGGGVVRCDLQRDRMRGDAVAVDEQARHPERVGLVAETVNLLTRERVRRDGVVILKMSRTVLLYSNRVRRRIGARGAFGFEQSS